MESNGRFGQTQLTVIDAAVSRIERREARKRELEAEQLLDFAAAMEAAVGRGVGAGDERELAYRSLRLELATALRESERTVDRLLTTAYLAQQDFPATLAALKRGEIALSHLRVVTDEGAPLETGQPAIDNPRRAAYEREVLVIAREETPARLRPIARRLAAAHAESTVAQRHEQAMKRRGVRVVDCDNGMADLVASLSAEDAYAIRDRIAQLAKRAVEGGRLDTRVGAPERLAPSDAGRADTANGEAVNRDAVNGDAVNGDAVSQQQQAKRSRDELRADIFRDLLLCRESEETAEREQVKAHIQVVIPAHGAAELMGYGPIDSLTASRLAGGADAWERIRVDDDGGIVSVDRYRPSQHMKRLLAARDLHCRAPGCRVPASRCDIDHTIDAAHGGPTSTANLAHLCRGHHTLKHHSDWTVSQQGNGEMRWTSPTGREYLDRPASRVRFRRPEAEEASRPSRT